MQSAIAMLLLVVADAATAQMPATAQWHVQFSTLC